MINRMSTAPRVRTEYTVEDYLRWEGRWELWEGVAVAMAPSPFGPHAKLLARTVAALQSAVDDAGCDATVLVEIDWIVARDTVLRPDALVVCGSEPTRHVERPPAVVVEVLSETTRDRDLSGKREIYREQGVAWYLVVDPERGRLRAFVSDAAGRSVEQELDERPVAIEICGSCRFTIDPAAIFRR